MATAFVEERALRGVGKQQQQQQQQLQQPSNPSPIDEPNWPMRCICALCECGGHRCSNFGLDERQKCAAEQRDAELGHLAQLRHCCNYTAASERVLAPLTLGSANCQAARAASQERSGTPEQSAVAKSEPKAKQEETPIEEEELLRVLVARPELARPRDNIVFEGNMDLRTTFETSYEALARMRLDQWRHYQQRRAEQQAESGANDGCATSGGAQTTNVSVETSKQLGPPSVATGERATATRDTAAPVSAAGYRGREIELTLQAKGAVRAANEQRSESSSSSSQRVASADLVDFAGRAKAEASSHRVPPMAAAAGGASAQSVGTANEQAELDGDERQWRSETAAGATGPTRARAAAAASGGSNFIDPDLSSIIVYDSNMDTLERVATRKRSKYRPSTSLRTGARGLFGDQRETAAEGPRETRAKANAAPPAQAAGLASQDAELRCESRNLQFTADSSAEQPGFPVESKRRVRDNANLTDHVRDDQLARCTLAGQLGSQATVAAGAELASERRERPDLCFERAEGAQQRATGEIELEAELAARDEAAAVAEIQRCTLGTPEDETGQRRQQLSASPEQQQQQQQPGAARLAALTHAGPPNNSETQRQARMQRMCQNQSFYLFDNDYPEPRGVVSEQRLKIGAPTSEFSATASPSSGALRVAADSKNLFRESPDFILTTATAAGEPAQRPKSKSRTIASTIRGRGSSEANGQASSGTKLLAAGANKEEPNERLDGKYVDNIQAQPDTNSPIFSEENIKIGDAEDGSISPSSNNNNNNYCYFSEHESNGRKTMKTTTVQKQGPCKKCRVLQLELDFDYVGLRSGHKYFIEKQYSYSTSPAINYQLIRD